MSAETVRQVPRERAVAFSKPEQVLEILGEAQRLRLQVLIRTSNEGKAVRGFMDVLDLREKTVRLSGISPAGDSLLRAYDAVKIEFILLSKKLVFVTTVKGRVPGVVSLAVPERLIAIERRHNVRFRVPPGQAAFAEFPDRKFEFARFDAPFVPSFLRAGEPTGVARLRIDDVSLGGVALFTRFAALAELFRADEGPINMMLQFPGQPALPVPISVRWCKKTTSAVEGRKYETLQRVLAQRLRGTMGNESFQMKETFIRLGLQFSEVSNELDAGLRSFIRMVQTSESV